MRELQQDSWQEERGGAGWPVRPWQGHPLVAGGVCLALAVGAWYGLLWGFRQTAEVGAPARARVATAQHADTQPVPKTGRVVLGPPASPPSLHRVPAAPRSSPRPSIVQVQDLKRFGSAIKDEPIQAVAPVGRAVRGAVLLSQQLSGDASPSRPPVLQERGGGTCQRVHSLATPWVRVMADTPGAQRWHHSAVEALNRPF